jgi:phosphonate transport system ATP-binding protein
MDTLPHVMRKPISPLVALDRVSKVFGDRCALDCLSVKISPGEFVAVIGRSGAGKTTFLRCLSRFTPVTTGTIRFGDQELTSLRGRALRAHRARVGMIYQQFNLVKRLRVIDNVLVGRLGHLRRGHGWAAMVYRFKDCDRDVALRCLDHVGMLDRAWQRTDTLSGGEQQRVAIAKILAQEPEIILADEPIASLDLANSQLVMDTLLQISRGAGLPVVATLHHVDFARQYAARILGFRAGRLVFDGPAAELTDSELQNIFGERRAEVAAPIPSVVGTLGWATS